jgi:hypothetical protein
VTSSPAGITCGTDCSEVYSHGTSVVLTAAATAGSTFTGWSGGGCSGTATTCTVTMTATTTVTANFTLNTYTLAVTKAGAGTGTVTSSPAGINCGADCNELYGHGTSVTLTAAPAAGSSFGGWSGVSGCGAATTCTVSMTAAATATATFNQIFYTFTVTKSGAGTGTITSSPAGVNCGTVCTVNVAHGTTLVLTATADANSAPGGWSGSGCAGTGTCTVTVTAAGGVDMAFNLRTYTVNITKTGSGTVTSSSGSINCGTTCSAAFVHGTTVTLTATPAAGYSWGGWGGSGPSVGCNGPPTCSFSIAGGQSITANFVPITYTLTVNVIQFTGTGSHVTSSTGGIDCYDAGGTCTATFNAGTAVSLTAIGAGSGFVGWGGNCSGTGGCSLTMNANKTVSASFGCATCSQATPSRRWWLAQIVAPSTPVARDR